MPIRYVGWPRLSDDQRGANGDFSQQTQPFPTRRCSQDSRTECPVEWVKIWPIPPTLTLKISLVEAPPPYFQGNFWCALTPNRCGGLLWTRVPPGIVVAWQQKPVYPLLFISYRFGACWNTRRFYYHCLFPLQVLYLLYINVVI